MAGARRETKKEFWDRIEREGRREEAEAKRDELVAEGYYGRDVQARLVERFQPPDGTKTKAWPTPDSWDCGRVDAKKPPPDELEQFDQAVVWVQNNSDRPLEEAPTFRARLLLETAQKRPAEFLKILVKSTPRIGRRERNAVKARQENVIERREKERKRVQAAKRQSYREAAREREAQAFAACQADEARRQAEAKKREEEKRQQKEARKQAAAASKADGVENGVSTEGSDEWEPIQKPST
jgi:hypothetical protein